MQIQRVHDFLPYLEFFYDKDSSHTFLMNLQLYKWSGQSYPCNMISIIELPGKHSVTNVMYYYNF